MRQDDSRETELDQVDLAWEAEIRRRLDAYHRGELKPVPAAEVFAKARALCSGRALADRCRPEEDAACEHLQGDNDSST